MDNMKELHEKVANDKELQAKFFEIMKSAQKAGTDNGKINRLCQRRRGTIFPWMK